jgi:metal-dependent amidase/aminoacylase/carboxypeptidase family protein
MLLALALLAAAPAASPATPDAEIHAVAERVARQVVAVRRDLHAHPELSNREDRTGHLVAERLRAQGLEVRYPVAKTGVVGILRGAQPGPVVALRADIDASHSRARSAASCTRAATTPTPRSCSGPPRCCSR